MIAVKLGGAAITNKQQERCFRTQVTQRLAEELATTDEPLLIVHGAGSFGHPQAKRYCLHLGWVPQLNQREGIAFTHATVRELNCLVLAALHRAGIPGVAIPPFPTLDKAYVDHIKQVIDIGLIPVTFGDVLIDGQPSIVSGDELMYQLSLPLQAKQAIFVTNVDGIYANPADPSTVIGTCTPDELQEAVVGGSIHSDVTAGMAGKVKSINEMVHSGVEVAIINGTKPGRLHDALHGSVKGTTVVLS